MKRIVVSIVFSIMCVSASADKFYFPVSIQIQDPYVKEYRITYDTDTKCLIVNRLMGMVMGLLPAYGDEINIINVKVKNIQRTSKSNAVGCKDDELLFVDDDNRIRFGIYVDKYQKGKDAYHDCYLFMPDHTGNLQIENACMVDNQIYQKWNVLRKGADLRTSGIATSNFANDKNNCQLTRRDDNIMKYIASPFGAVSPASLENVFLTDVNDIIIEKAGLHPVWDVGNRTIRGRVSKPELNTIIEGQNVYMADITIDSNQRKISWSYLWSLESDTKRAKEYLRNLVDQLQKENIKMDKIKVKDSDEFYEGHLNINNHDATVYMILGKKTRHDTRNSILMSVSYRW